MDEKPKRNRPRGPETSISIARLKEMLRRAEQEYQRDEAETDPAKKLSNTDRIKILALQQRIGAMLVQKDKHKAIIEAAWIAQGKRGSQFT